MKFHGNGCDPSPGKTLSRYHARCVLDIAESDPDEGELGIGDVVDGAAERDAANEIGGGLFGDGVVGRVEESEEGRCVAGQEDERRQPAPKDDALRVAEGDGEDVANGSDRDDEEKQEDEYEKPMREPEDLAGVADDHDENAGERTKGRVNDEYTGHVEDVHPDGLEGED
ncbi:hypothetical protein BC938DRAFT_479749 [Jimgerdemannia flammicorona]|uniref:Uncharacterized protein n=1 Tax=Jimgerdemannia flammicorona TaxID=994334 RepID=A0A433QK98_9FUNG|nr:hypothetical protein BC938DRAFT_479749 [Jimgerdemannia flammicorona]